FRAHRQGRRRRFKVRTRTYVNSGLCMFEVKFKGHRGETVKHRMPYRMQDSSGLTEAAEEFLAAQLEADYGLTLPILEPSLSTDYTRGTLVNPLTRERLTCDVDLVFGNLERTVRAPDLVVVETKTMDGFGVADQALAAMGIRPVSMSKYCLGIALLHPDLPANRWNRLLRDSFGWCRELPGQADQGH
ncbi:MAG: hypothetical protein M3021_05515, partial [Actinomycetota bacterium]|nr:hypothetical protein [Actinomycetota bacterium]